MKAIINRLISNNLNELKGLRVEGEIPVTQEFLNDLIKIYMEGNPVPAGPPSDEKEQVSSGIDMKKILEGLDKKEVNIELKEKVALIKVSIRKF